MFSTVWQAEENRRRGKPGRLFYLLGPQSFSSQIERKSLERKFSLSTFTVMPSPPTSFMTFSPTPPNDSCPQLVITFFPLLILTSQHQRPAKMFSSLPFFFQCDLLFLVLIILLIHLLFLIDFFVSYDIQFFFRMPILQQWLFFQCHFHQEEWGYFWFCGKVSE